MTQNNTGIPISFSHNLSPIRLIELPPALLPLLKTSNDSPRPTLYIKASSAPTSDSSSSTQPPTSHAVLTTPTQTYSLRQVYSSNSILLLQPTSSSSNTNLTVVSAVNSYMELIPAACDATTLILQHVPVFPPPGSVAPVTRTSLLSSLPVSPAEFNAAWTNLCCFDCPEGFAYRPLPSTILETLKAISLINYHDFDDGVDLAKFLPEDIIEAIDRYYALAHGVDDDEDDDEDEQDEEPRRCVPGLVKSVLAEVSMCGSRGLGGDYRAIVKDKLMEWVGRLVLEDWALKGKGDMLYISFMTKWRQEVPDWLSAVDCELKLIEGWYILPTPNTIRFAPGGKVTPAEAEAAAKSQKRNKWHERLGKGKRR